MVRDNPSGECPSINSTAFIDSSAIIVGNVKIGKKVFIGPGAVIRADEPGSSVVICDDCNIQDRVVIHALQKTSVLVGKNTSLSHGCIIHGPCKIEKNCFVGFGSVVFNAHLQTGVVVKHLAVIEGVKVSCEKLIPSGSVCASQNEAVALKRVDKDAKNFCAQVIKANSGLLKGYSSGAASRSHA